MHRVGFFQIKRDPWYYKNQSVFGYTFLYPIQWLKTTLNSSLSGLVDEKPTVTIGEVFEGFPYSETNQRFKLHDNIFKSIEIASTGYIERWLFNPPNTNDFYPYKVKYYDKTRSSASSILFTKHIAEIYKNEVYGIINPNIVTAKSMGQYCIDWVAQSSDLSIRKHRDLWDVISFLTKHPVLNTITDNSPVSRYYHVNLSSCVQMLEGVMENIITPDKALDRIMMEIYPNIGSSDIDTLTYNSTPMTLSSISKGISELPTVFSDTSSELFPACLEVRSDTVYSPMGFDQIYKIFDRLKISDIKVTYTLYKGKYSENVIKWYNRFNATVEHDLNIMRQAIKIIPYMLGSDNTLIRAGKFADYVEAVSKNQPIVITVEKSFSDEVLFTIKVGDWDICTIHLDLALLPLSANGLTVSAT